MNDFVMLRLVRERHEEEMRQAEHDRLVAELRSAATPTRQKKEERRTSQPGRLAWCQPIGGSVLSWHRVNPRGVLHGRPL